MLHCCDYTRPNFAHSSLFPVSLLHTHTRLFPSLSHSLSLFAITVHPVIQVPNQLVGAPLGTDVQIECHVEASPKSINYWIKDTGECVHLSHSLYIGVCMCVCVLCFASSSVKHHKFSIL